MIIKICYFDRNSVVIDSDDKRFKKMYGSYRIRVNELWEEMREIDKFVFDEYREDTMFEIGSKKETRVSVSNDFEYDEE